MLRLDNKNLGQDFNLVKWTRRSYFQPTNVLIIEGTLQMNKLNFNIMIITCYSNKQQINHNSLDKYISFRNVKCTKQMNQLNFNNIMIIICYSESNKINMFHNRQIFFLLGCEINAKKSDNTENQKIHKNPSKNFTCYQQLSNLVIHSCQPINKAQKFADPIKPQFTHFYYLKQKHFLAPEMQIPQLIYLQQKYQYMIYRNILQSSRAILLRRNTQDIYAHNTCIKKHNVCINQKEHICQPENVFNNDKHEQNFSGITMFLSTQSQFEWQPQNNKNFLYNFLYDNILRFTFCKFFK
eukprot:TRINITY_DN14252_c0_g2_i8.p1 TRINITY_DN14252_c0_g2~~TRINITY_DN14252_c0_g2_i8.p1  ORF type:complete len:296 (-),score=-23.16 TRINITY_DN14252_c0_g2_i8:527-1414(-)